MGTGEEGRALETSSNHSFDGAARENGGKGLETIERPGGGGAGGRLEGESKVEERLFDERRKEERDRGSKDGMEGGKVTGRDRSFLSSERCKGVLGEGSRKVERRGDGRGGMEVRGGRSDR